MHLTFTRKCLLIFLLCLGNGWAASAVVDAVQMPAWIEQGGRVAPLLPGQQVNEGDRVRTGQGARVYLTLAEGSTVKLGESALLTYQSAVQQESLFKAALNVTAGAFRFTTAAIRRLQKRDVAIRVGNATIGIRGTDVWGRSGKDEDLVMLIEGHVEVRPAQGEVVRLTEPLAVFTAPKTGAANPVATATRDELNTRARETEIESGGGVLRRGGNFKLLFGSFDDQQQALALYDRIRAAGFGAVIRPLMIEGGQAGSYRYEVAITGFSSKADAAAAAGRLKHLAGIEAENAAPRVPAGPNQDN